jgi:acyl-[acyl-carrier-protein]-phospholipid O-acyltransferase/long-chain-fatty-acid--[acyl-carrier-protein] ligase
MPSLLRTLGALPFLIAVFLNAFVDLGHKIVIQNTIFKVYDGPEQVILTAIVNALILLPFILLFSPAGFVSDKYPKSHIMRAAAWGAVGLTTAITVCYAQGWFWPAFLMTFLLAVQSAFYSPAKYGYIKGLFGKQRLAQANGLVQAISMIAILAGTFIFSIAFEYWYVPDADSKNAILQNLVPIGFILIVNSLVELVMMYQLPQQEETDHSRKFIAKDYLTGKAAAENIKVLLTRPAIRQAMIGLAIFWSAGQVMLAAFPAFAKMTLGETNTVIIQAILGASGIGIAIGSALAGRLSRNYIETGLIPVGAVGFALGLCFLPSLESYWSMTVSFLFIGMMGGFFIVPLNALIQFYAKDDELGKLLATNNLVQSMSMLLFLGLTVMFSLMALSPQMLLVLIAIVALVGSGYTVIRLPQSLVRLLFAYIVSRRYRINVEGMKNIPEKKGVLLLGNHISWIDWAIVQIACPRPVRFVMLKSIYERWYLKWFFQLFGCIPIQSGASSQQSLEQVAELLNNGEVVCLFPEGMISRNGHLAEFRRGYERAAEMCQDDVVILPFYLRGLWGSQFSRSSENFKRVRGGGIRRDLIVAFGQPLAKDVDVSVLKRRVFDLSISSWQAYAKTLPALPHAWIDSVKRQGNTLSIADTLGQPLSTQQALTGVIAFSQRIKRLSPEKNIGLLLPTSAGGILANMAVLLCGKTVVNLNYTASSEAFSSSLEQAEIKTVYTSKRFLDKLRKKGFNFEEILSQYNVIYLEEVKESIPKWKMLTTLIAVKLLPTWLLKLLYARTVDNQDTAAILFSSGSEGLPKGIQLSHMNIMANLKQIADVLNTREDDVVMASLPLFHAFGLTVTQFMPLIEGMPLVCHADPTDALACAKAVAKYRATIMCGTSTFLRLYCRNNKVHPLMLESLRITVSGAEKLNPAVREAFKSKFNKDIYEGYGATETTPVAGVNIPAVLSTEDWKVQVGDKPGTVGMPLPGTSFKIVDPDSFEELPTDEDGMILIGGAQVMQGYLNNPEKTHQVIKEIDGIRWYVTGDKGHLDKDGFLTIVDRYSRFAKLGGEMISLSVVESNVQKAIQASIHDESEQVDDIEVIAVNLPDDKKGEKIILLSEAELDHAALREMMLASGCNPLMVPSEILTVEVLPKLGSGKVDFAKAKVLAAG